MLIYCYDKSMTASGNIIVTINTGSSSIKLALFENTSELKPLGNITVNNIGQSNVPDHQAASRILLEKLAAVISPDSIIAIGYRLVHGGTKYTEPTLVQAISESDWDMLSRLDPNHTPMARQVIAQFNQRYPTATQIACFDTAFFHDLPHVARILPIPQKYYALGARRYGFHGLSYTSLVESFRAQAGETAANGRVILAHLGSGASLTAMQAGRPIDTTMGLTPASGVVMSTRSGDVDPGLFSFLHQQQQLSLEDFDHMASAESGLLGVSGQTGDMYQLLQLETTHSDAALAIALFVREIKKTIGAFAAVMGGVDSLIFSGGIGEQSAVLRQRICEGFGHIGIAIDETANAQHAFLISSSESKTGVHVIPSNEAHVIASQTTYAIKAHEVQT